MKNLDLNNYGVQEMNAGEMRGTDGGILGISAFAIAVGTLSLGLGVAIVAAGMYASFKAGYNDVQ